MATVDEKVIMEGTDPSELLVSQSEKTKEIIHDGKKYTFYYKNLSWHEKYKCLDDAHMIDGDQVRFSLSKYYSLMLSKMLIRGPLNPITETTINKLDEDVGSQLIDIVPPPVNPNMGQLKKE
jgi:hypothetical protein